ncbi:MAG: hypothetical protein SFT92_03495 [Rickettsiales bacterium]|nr:hypothetical protein [Rickettsiales bacterium]
MSKTQHQTIDFSRHGFEYPVLLYPDGSLGPVFNEEYFASWGGAEALGVGGADFVRITDPDNVTRYTLHPKNIYRMASRVFDFCYTDLETAYARWMASDADPESKQMATNFMKRLPEYIIANPTVPIGHLHKEAREKK